MDEDMDDTFVEEFLAVEIDLDYEFDASRYFDFSKEESPSEAREAEFWFETARSYPPSPFVAKLNLGSEIFEEENVNTSPKPDVEGRISISTLSDTDMGRECSVLDDNCRGQEGMERAVFANSVIYNPQNIQNKPQGLIKGLTFYNHMEKDIRKPITKSAMKASFSRGSTLMKPTASQLAKQNRPRERFQKPLFHNSDRSLDHPSAVEIQAAKRQKLEGGHLHKVTDAKQQCNLMHKAPKKDGPVNGNFAQAKLKITIPREPDLETMHRAQRMRPKASTELGEQVKSTRPMFKARPLNRKILEAPSLPLPKKSTPRLPEFQEFHLKTSERAMQHSSVTTSSAIPCNKSDKVVHKAITGSMIPNGTTETKRPSSVDVPKQEGCETTHKFKARPLNKKIFSSKGDIGVFRNSKREPTIPMEFNFPTDKRFQYNPPVDLFNKLSLTTELQQNTTSQPRLPRPTCIPTKGSKENTLDSLQQQHRTVHTVREKAQTFGFKQNQCGSDVDTEVSTRGNMSRSLDIR